MPSWVARTGLTVLALAAAVALGGAARADGNGLKFGNARLHPFIEIEAAYDSAVFVGGNGNIAGDLILHFRPGPKLDIPSPMFSLLLNGNVEYLLYTGVVDSGTRSDSHIAADADLDMGINRDGQFGVDIGDHFTRSDRITSTPAMPIGVLSLYNDARLKLNIRPYSGAITISPGYHFTVETFSCMLGGDPLCTGATASAQDYMNHNITLDGRWKFLPKTAVTVAAVFGIRSYLQSGTGSTDLMTLKAALGLTGLITSHLNVLLRVGWGQDFTTNSYSSLIAQAEIAWLFSETASVRGGYVRTFDPLGPPYASFGDDRAYLEGKLLLGGKLSLRGNVAFDWLIFNAPRTGTTTNASRATVAVDVGADYEIKPWVSVGGGYRLSFLASESSNDTILPGLKDFTRHEGYLKVVFIY